MMRNYIYILFFMIGAVYASAQNPPKITTTQIQNLIVDSTRINATGDTAYYYQNGVLIGTGAIAGGGGGGYWTQTGSDIYYNTGNVGIGTSSAVDGLTVGQYETPTLALRQKTTIGVYGDTSAYFRGRDITRDIEFIMGTSVNGSVFAGSMTNHKMTLRTGNQVAMTIDTFQNVGIGTQTPSAKLDVAGSMVVDDSTLVIDATNNRVGIGTSSPAGELDVNGLIRAGILEYDADYRSTVSTSKDGANYFEISAKGTGTGGTPAFSTIFSRGTHVSPLVPEIGDRTFAIFNRVWDGDGYDVNPAAVTFFVDHVDTTASPREVGASIYFETGRTTAGARNKVLSVTSDGNVGIGTTSPTKTLDVVGQGQITGDTYPLWLINRDNRTLNGVWGTTTYRATKTSALGDGFGAALSFQVANPTNVYNIGDIGFYRSGNDSTGAFQIRTYDDAVATTRMTIAADGNVGIGTTSPNEKLDVRGRIEVQETTDPSQAGSGLGTIYANSSNSKLYYRDDSGNNYDLTSTATTSDGSWTNSGAVTYLTDSGDKVGIGTSSPGAKFTVVKDSNPANQTSIASTAIFASDNPSTLAMIGYVGADNNVGGPLFNGYKARNTVASPQAAQSGDIGLGFSGYFWDTSVASDWKFGSTIQMVRDAGTGSQYRVPSAITFKTSQASDNNIYERMRITSDGKVGIGTSSPSTKLSVEGNATTGSRNLIEVQDPNYDGYFGIGSGSGSNFAARLEGGTSGVNGIGATYIAAIPEVNDSILSTSPGTAVVNFQAREYSDFVNRTGASAVETANVVAFNNYSTNLMLIEADGDVLMPAVYNTNTSGARTVYINSDGKLVATSSSIDTKNIVGNYNKGIDWIKKLNPVYYTYKKDDRKLIQAGFIAEEFDVLGLNEFVGYSLEGKADGINYSQLTTLTVKAIQEQQAIIESQATEIETLKTLITELSNRLQILENN